MNFQYLIDNMFKQDYERNHYIQDTFNYALSSGREDIIRHILPALKQENHTHLYIQLFTKFPAPFVDLVPSLNNLVLSGVYHYIKIPEIQKELDSRFVRKTILDELTKTLLDKKPGYLPEMQKLFNHPDYSSVKKLASESVNIVESNYYKDGLKNLSKAMIAFYTPENIYTIGDLRLGGTLNYIKKLTSPQWCSLIGKSSLGQIETLLANSTQGEILYLADKIASAPTYINRLGVMFEKITQNSSDAFKFITILAKTSYLDKVEDYSQNIYNTEKLNIFKTALEKYKMQQQISQTEQKKGFKI